jgi:hypothetical protein
MLKILKLKHITYNAEVKKIFPGFLSILLYSPGAKPFMKNG